ncbi:hypothetical protein AAY473_028343 [Plecturocebus cupreus]
MPGPEFFKCHLRTYMIATFPSSTGGFQGCPGSYSPVTHKDFPFPLCLEVAQITFVFIDIFGQRRFFRSAQKAPSFGTADSTHCACSERPEIQGYSFQDTEHSHGAEALKALHMSLGITSYEL